MGRGTIRRAAGTVTFLDLLRSPGRLLDRVTGRGGARAEADVAALRAGEGREVSAFVRDGRRFRQGSLVLDPGARSPVVWRPYRFPGRRGPAVALTGPLRVRGEGPVDGPGSPAVDRGAFRLLTVEAADRSWELAVPAVDLPLVRAALRLPVAGT
ncbi:hypothetical protein ACFWEO_28165 [Streptomyces roseolus]|uniref:hypothetical protein n=2 Tax=Streptomyces roseolus TaxID=67358 RepID=UPI0036390577